MAEHKEPIHLLILIVGITVHVLYVNMSIYTTFMSYMYYPQQNTIKVLICMNKIVRFHQHMPKA